jgi:hypothetical protein
LEDDNYDDKSDEDANAVCDRENSSGKARDAALQKGDQTNILEESVSQIMETQAHS